LSGLSIHTNDLLALPVGESAQDAGFRRGSVTAQAQDVARRDIFLVEISEQCFARLDVAWPVSPTRDGRRQPVLSFSSTQAF
jgi:hypothetical protein